MVTEQAPEQPGRTIEIPVPGALLADYLQAADEIGVHVGEIKFAGDEEIERDEDGEPISEHCLVEMDLGALPGAYARIVQRVSELSQPH